MSERQRAILRELSRDADELGIYTDAPLVPSAWSQDTIEALRFPAYLHALSCVGPDDCSCVPIRVEVK